MPRLAARAALFLLALCMIASCATMRERAALIHRPHEFEPVPGRMPLLYVQITPRPSADYMLVVNTPDAEAYLTVGAAVEAAYVEALRAYFDVDTKRAKYADYVAFVELDKISLVIEPSGKRMGVFMPSIITYRHEVPITTLREYPVETLVVQGSAEAVLDATDYKSYMRGVAMAVEDILYAAGPRILEHFRGLGRGGTYRQR